MRLAGPSYLAQSLWIILPLALARDFRVYVVSGLENPLSFFLFAWLMVELFGPRKPNYYRFCFIAALASITRLDDLVPLAPLALVLSWHERQKIHRRRLLAALSPALFWYAFSLFYYGFFFPNTKYAKLNMGVATLDYVRQGMVYLANFMQCDPLAFLWCVAGIIVMLRYLPEAWRTWLTVNRATLLALLGIGCLCNVIVLAGGDFMPGRFFANIFFISVGALAVVYAPGSKQEQKILTLCLLAITFYNHFVLQPNLPDRRDESMNGGIDDQHDGYYPGNGLRSDSQHFLRRAPESEASEKGNKWRAETEADKVIPATASGVELYYAGPHIIMIDRVGLGDALLARLPIENVHRWRVGHALRAVPAGYVEARETGDTSHMDPALAAYFGKLRLVTAGDLWSMERLKCILGFQLGLYDHWRDDYVSRITPPAMTKPVSELLSAHPVPVLFPAMNFKGRYVLAFINITFGRAAIEVTQDSSHYRAAFDVLMPGMLDVFAKYSSHSVAEGNGKAYAYPDVTYESDYRTHGKARSAHVAFKNAAPTEETLTPPENPWKHELVSAAMKQGAVDPASALLVLRAGVSAALAHKQPGFLMTLYDGRRLVKVEAELEGTQKIRYAGAWVPVVALSLKAQPVSGFDKGRSNVAAVPVLYFSDDMQLKLLRMEIPLPIGAITATLDPACGGSSCLLGNKD